jgi:hypothetical protein
MHATVCIDFSMSKNFFLQADLDMIQAEKCAQKNWKFPTENSLSSQERIREREKGEMAQRRTPLCDDGTRRVARARDVVGSFLPSFPTKPK